MSDKKGIQHHLSHELFWLINALERKEVRGKSRDRVSQETVLV